MTSLFAQSELWPVMAIAGLGLVITMLMLRGQRSRMRQQQDDRSPRVSQAGIDLTRCGGHSTLRDRQEVEMHDRVREITGTLDSKMSALQALIADADRAAARLEAALDATPPVTPKEDRGERPAPGPPPPAAEQQRDEVHTLADYGYPPLEIAARLGRPLGEIELILKLRNEKA
ncbi:MAG: hypothetical protein ACOC46_04595 [Pirellulales bacterium]